MNEIDADNDIMMKIIHHNNAPAFNTYIVQEKDLENFITLLKNPKKK